MGATWSHPLGRVIAYTKTIDVKIIFLVFIHKYSPSHSLNHSGITSSVGLSP